MKSAADYGGFMNFRKCMALLFADITAVGIISSCSTGEKVGSVPDNVTETTNAVTETATAPPVTTLPEIPLDLPTIKKQEYEEFYETEKGKLKNGMRVGCDYDDFSGDGYVVGFGEGGILEISVKLPSDQYYDLTFRTASNDISRLGITADGKTIAEFDTSDNGIFTDITVSGVYLSRNTSVIGIQSALGDFAVDFVKITDGKCASENTALRTRKPVNKNASNEAVSLMNSFADCYGKYIITGQYVSDENNAEIELIYNTTGKYPVVRCSELSDSKAETDAVAEWYRNGGIPFITWYWNSPSDESSVLSEKTDFSLSDAVCEKDIAKLSLKDIEKLCSDGEISEQCLALVRDIDSTAEILGRLDKQNIPVLWRPLPEGGGNWYWWGADGEKAYKWLWELVYNRMTAYHKLSNLLWVWNGQSKEYMVNRSMFDIASADIYISGEKDYGNRFCEKFAAIQRFVGEDKLIALSECGSVPDTVSAFRDNAVWSFFGLWNGEYIMTESGEYSEEYTGLDALLSAYNSEGVLTLDEYREVNGIGE